MHWESCVPTPLAALEHIHLGSRAIPKFDQTGPNFNVTVATQAWRESSRANASFSCPPEGPISGTDLHRIAHASEETTSANAKVRKAVAGTRIASPTV